MCPRDRQIHAVPQSPDNRPLLRTHIEQSTTVCNVKQKCSKKKGRNNWDLYFTYILCSLTCWMQYIPGGTSTILHNTGVETEAGQTDLHNTHSQYPLKLEHNALHNTDENFRLWTVPAQHTCNNKTQNLCNSNTLSIQVLHSSRQLGS